MKKIIVSLLLLIFCKTNAQPGSSYVEKSDTSIVPPGKIASVGSDTTHGDSDKVAQLTSQVNLLTQSINDLIKNNSKDTEESIGIFKLRDNVPVVIYSDRKKTGKTVIIDHVSLLIQDGYIIQVQAFSGDEKFMNMQAPIAVNALRFARQDFLGKCKKCIDGDSSVILQDFLLYTTLKPFAPNDTLVWLQSPPGKDTSDRITLKKGVGINSVLDLRLYSDALGLFGTTPNAIVETDVSFKQTFRTNNIANSGFNILRYFKLNFNASKFDSKNNVEPADSGVFSRTGLLQKSYINGEIALNIFRDWVNKNSLSIWYTDVGAGINIGNIAKKDTIAKTIDTLAVTTQNLFGEIGVNLKTSSNIGSNIYLRELVQFSPQTNFYNEDKPVWFTKISGEVYWNPFNNPASRIFARMNYLFSSGKDEKKDHFFQFQFGYSVLLSKLIGK